MEREPFVNSICPYLKSIDDEKTAYAYPTFNNRCFLTHIPVDIVHQHQAFFCLDAHYQECYVYREPQIANRGKVIGVVAESMDSTQPSASFSAYDREVELEGSDQGRRAILFVIAVVVFFGTLFAIDARRSKGDLSANATQVTLVPTKTPIPSPTWTPIPSATATETVTPTATVTPSPSATQTRRPTATATATRTATASMPPTIVRRQTPTPVKTETGAQITPDTVTPGP